jgi:predicted nucleotide-binding protein
MKPSLFIASSSESIEVAYALQENLESNAEVTVWSQGIFQPSRFALESLIDVLDSTDFAMP